MSLDRILKAPDPENVQQRMAGWLPGIVLDLKDPESLGRVRVSCPLIGSDPLPNNHDGWIQMLNSSSGGGSPGGTHDLIQEGDQVVLLPMMGDLTNCIAIGVLHSVADPPSPHFDRAGGVYGSHSPNDDLEIKDEKNQRQIKRVSGNTETIDAAGNRIIESPNGAKATFGADGDIRIENDKGTIGLGPKGELTVSNNSATIGFSESGSVDISVKDIPAIVAGPLSTSVAGPVDEVARNVGEFKDKALGAFSRYSLRAEVLRALALELRSPLEYDDRLEIIYQIDVILESLLPELEQITVSQTALEALSKSESLDIGTKVVGQIDLFRSTGLTVVAQKYAGGVDSRALDRLGEDLSQMLEPELLATIDLEQLTSTLKALQHNPEEQLKAVLGSIVPVDRIDAVLGNALHKNIGRLNAIKRTVDDLGIDDALSQLDALSEEGSNKFESVLENIARLTNSKPPISPGATKSLVAGFKRATEQISQAVENVKGNIDLCTGYLKQVDDLRTSYDLQTEFGTAALGKVNELVGCVSAITPAYERAVKIESLTTALLSFDDSNDELSQIQSIADRLGSMTPNGSLTDISSKVLPLAIESMLDLLDEPMTVGWSAAIDLEQTVSSKTNSGELSITADGPKNSANSGDTGGNVVQNKERAGVYGPGANRGVGAKVEAESGVATVAAAGSERSLGSKVEAHPDRLELKAPGADLGLGTWFTINQEQAYFYAPGGKQKIGSMMLLDRDNICLFAPGGTDGAGSSIKLQLDNISLSAPGGENASSLILNTEQALLFSPGGKYNAGGAIALDPEYVSITAPGGQKDKGSALKLEEDTAVLSAKGGSKDGSSLILEEKSTSLSANKLRQGGGFEFNLDTSSIFSSGGLSATKIKLNKNNLALSYPGITGGSIVLSNNKVKLDLPVLQNKVELTSSGVSISTMLAKVRVSQIGIDLTVGGTGIRILPGIILVNGIPLQGGGQLF